MRDYNPHILKAGYPKTQGLDAYKFHWRNEFDFPMSLIEMYGDSRVNVAPRVRIDGHQRKHVRHSSHVRIGCSVLAENLRDYKLLAYTACLSTVCSL